MTANVYSESTCDVAVIYKVTARESVDWVENYTLIANQSTESRIMQLLAGQSTES